MDTPHESQGSRSASVRSSGAGTSTEGLGRLYQAASNFADLRRVKLTQLDVLSAAPPLRSLHVVHILIAALVAIMYARFALPRISCFGSDRWRANVGAALTEARPGGPFSDVSLSYVVLLSLGYVSLSFLGVTRMAQRRAPVQVFVFECAAVHNVTQCLFNLYCFVALLGEGRALGLRIWGNARDASDKGHALGGLLWLQYHCRQLQLLETAFMVLQKKFQGISFVHLYLRVLNLWGWFIACRCVGGGEAYFPAVVSSVCQALVYGLYFSFSLSLPGCTCPLHAGARAAWVFRLHIAQYVVCAIHSVAAATWGHFPRGLAALHIFVIANGLILYTDFHSQEPQSILCNGSTSRNLRNNTQRVTFSFDSCGWLMVYHFGVGAWLSEHLGLEINNGVDDAASEGELPAGVAFSGSSGGSLVSCVLGSGVRVSNVFEYILEQYPECRRNPLRMFPAVERALRRFQYEGAHKRLTGRLRILLTRVTWRPPFIMGEVADSFPDNETAVQVLCASCHVPMIAGLLPRRVAGRCYYDGLLWPSRLLVPWRGAEGDYVVRISASGAPLADIVVPRVPFWWAFMPPPPRLLRGIFWCGYRDAAKWVCTEPKATFDQCKCRRSARREQADRMSTAAEGHKGATDDLLRWQSVRALLSCDARVDLPEVDPATGESVTALIEDMTSLADRESRTTSRVLSALLAVAVPLLLATIPALYE